MPKDIRLQAFATALALALCAQPAVAHAVTSSELQSRLDEATAQLDSLNSQADAAFSDLEEAQSSLEVSQERSDELQGQIAQTQLQLDEAKGQLATLVSGDYKSQVSFIDFLLGATDFQDLVTRVHYADRISEYQAGVIDGVTTAKAQLDAENDQLNAEIERQTELVDQRQQKAQEVQDLAAQQKSYVDGLSEEVQQALAQEEEQRKQEEAAAAAAAAAAASQQAASDPTADAATSDAGTTTSDTPRNTGTSSSSASSSSSSSSSSGSGTTVNNGRGVSAAVANALSQVGVAYSWSGRAIAGQEFDCSGLVWWAYTNAGISIPRGQRMSNGYGNSMIGRVLQRGGFTTDISALKPGDLMFWGGSVNSTTHVGMYIGNGKMVHANYGGVEVTSASYASGSFVGGGPIV